MWGRSVPISGQELTRTLEKEGARHRGRAWKSSLTSNAPYKVGKVGHRLVHVHAAVLAQRRLLGDGAEETRAAGRVRPGDAIARPQGLADGVAVRAGSQGDDAPDHLVADDHGQLDPQGQRALPEVDIGAADRTRLNACQDRS